MTRPLPMRRQNDPGTGPIRFGLSHREQEVVSLVRQGLTNKEIADLLSVSVDTVKDHLKNIFQKTGATNRTELVFRLYWPVPQVG